VGVGVGVGLGGVVPVPEPLVLPELVEEPLVDPEVVPELAGVVGVDVVPVACAEVVFTLLRLLQPVIPANIRSSRAKHVIEVLVIRSPCRQRVCLCPAI